MKKTSTPSRAELLAKVPDGTTRVLVQTDKGEQKYKALDQLADTDVIQTAKDGTPIVMKGKPGRKAAVPLAPATEVVAEIIKRKKGAIDHDPLLKTAKTAPESPDVLQHIILGLGEEAASLAFERDEAARQGKDSSGHSTKRVQALRAMGETWLKRMDQVVARTVDLDSPGFKVLFKFIMDTIREAMNSANMRPEQVETVFAKFASMVNEDWHNEARNRMKNAS